MGRPRACSCGRGREERRSGGLPLRSRPHHDGLAASNVATGEAVGGGGARAEAGHCGRSHGMAVEVVASVDGRGGCRIKLMRLLDGCVATAARRACKRLQGSFCSAVKWPSEVHTLGSIQLGPECAKSLWPRTSQVANFLLANQVVATCPLNRTEQPSNQDSDFSSVRFRRCWQLATPNRKPTNRERRARVSNIYASDSIANKTMFFLATNRAKSR